MGKIIVRIQKNVTGKEGEGIDLPGIAEDVETEMRENAPYKTGKLRSSIGIKEVNSRSAWIEASADYASYVNGGTTRMDSQPFADSAAWNARNNNEGIITEVREEE